jgi:hypothetical protein
VIQHVHHQSTAETLATGQDARAGLVGALPEQADALDSPVQDFLLFREESRGLRRGNALRRELLYDRPLPRESFAQVNCAVAAAYCPITRALASNPLRSASEVPPNFCTSMFLLLTSQTHVYLALQYAF